MIGGIAAGTAILAPAIGPELGLGEDIATDLNKECCTVVGTNVGLAGELDKLFSEVPFVDAHMNTAGGHNIMAPAAVILGGHVAGNAVSQYEHRHHRPGNIGAAIRIGSMMTGIALALPALLPALGHGIQFLARGAGLEAAGVGVAQFLGNTSVCLSDATVNGITTGTPSLLAHLPCTLPAIFAAAPVITTAAITEREQFTEKEALQNAQKEVVDALRVKADPAMQEILDKWHLLNTQDKAQRTGYQL